MCNLRNTERGNENHPSSEHTLEAQGVALRGSFTSPGEIEWCDRRLLARIHCYTVSRLRREIEPVSGANFMRFPFAWQQVSADSGLR